VEKLGMNRCAAYQTRHVGCLTQFTCRRRVCSGMRVTSHRCTTPAD
jgi:hypothetical protein